MLATRSNSPGFKCPLEANTYGITFQAFSIKDDVTKRLLFEVATPVDGETETMNIAELLSAGLDEETLNEMRTIRYEFNVDVLRLPRICTSYVAAVGQEGSSVDGIAVRACVIQPAGFRLACRGGHWC